MQQSAVHSFAEITTEVQGTQKPDRLLHIFGVLQSSLALAELYGVDTEKAALAALLHDCAKHYGREQTMALHKLGQINLTEEDLKYPALWHGSVAAWLAKSRFGITDAEVLDAVEHHTVGHSDPSPLLQILMCADYTEPTRTQPGVQELRLAVRNNLRTGLSAVLDAKIEEIIAKGQEPHSRIYETKKSLEN